MDPQYPQRNRMNSGTNLRESAPNAPGDQTADGPDGGTPGTANPQAADRQPQYAGGFTMIPPNESRRKKLKTMAQKEEEELQRWKESHRVSSVQLDPERLGGSVTLAEARQKQLTDHRSSKLQKKLRQEELDRRKRQEEEAKLQEMKAIQRQKTERLEERNRQEEQTRREQHRQDHLRATERFLQRFERSAPGPLASGSAAHTSSGSEAVESKQREQKSERDVQLEHKRVNSAFLDRLEGRGREAGGEVAQEAERPRLPPEDFKRPPPAATGQQLPPAHLAPDAGETEEADLEPDYDWSLMKLMNSFPDCNRVFLEDILDQCNGDYEQAYTLLICSLS